MNISKTNKIADLFELLKNQEMLEKTFKSYSEQLHARTLHIKEVGISGKLLNDWFDAGIVNKVEVIKKWIFLTIHILKKK